MSGVKQGQQTALAVERHQVIAAAHMGIANENLRHGTAAGNLHHFFALTGHQVYPDFVQFGHATLGQQLFGGNAVRASACRVNFDGLHISS